MTEYTVGISITINIGKRVIKAQEKINAEDVEEVAQEIGVEIGQEVLKNGIEELDRQIAQEVPKNWHNVGTEERWIISSVSFTLKNGHWVKQIDDILPQTHWEINIPMWNEA
jgi:DUF917 family protein